MTEQLQDYHDKVYGLYAKVKAKAFAGKVWLVAVCILCSADLIVSQSL